MSQSGPSGPPPAQVPDGVSAQTEIRAGRRDAPTLALMSRPQTRADRRRQSLLLGPGVGLVGVALVSLLRQTTVLGWIILAIGLVLLLTYLRGTVHRRVARRGAEPR
jgi:hypothetical protein